MPKVGQCAGYAAEILYPADLFRFEGFAADAQFAFASLVLSTWLYHFCQVGTAVMAPATSLVALERGVLPRWLALAGFLVALLHFLVPLLGAHARRSGRRVCAPLPRALARVRADQYGLRRGERGMKSGRMSGSTASSSTACALVRNRAPSSMV